MHTNELGTIVFYEENNSALIEPTGKVSNRVRFPDVLGTLNRREFYSHRIKRDNAWFLSAIGLVELLVLDLQELHRKVYTELNEVLDKAEKSKDIKDIKEFLTLLNRASSIKAQLEYCKKFSSWNNGRGK